MAKEVFYEVWILGERVHTTDAEKYVKGEKFKTEFENISELRERFCKDLAHFEFQIYKVVRSRFDRVPKIENRYQRTKRKLEFIPDPEPEIFTRPAAIYSNKQPFGIAS